MANQYFYDRVDLYIDGIPYLPNGQIRNFSLQVTYNTKPVQGFSPTGLASGKVIGNKTINAINWTEYLPQLDEFLNWRTFCLANPNAVLLCVPVSLATGVPSAPSFTINGIDPSTINFSAPSEGEVMTRDISFNAIDSSNT